MAKKNKLNWNTITTLSLVIVILLLIFGILLKIGSLGFLFDNNLGDFQQINPIENEFSNCQYYDITQEYRNVAGSDFVNSLESQCENNFFGIAKLLDDELSCQWNPGDVTIDCSSEALLRSESFCENTLKATYVCDNTVGFVGCICGKNPPQALEENCWWQKVDEYNGQVDFETEIEWKNTLVDGEFKFSWDLSDSSEVTIVKDFSSVKFFQNTLSGEYEFTSKSEDWGISVNNPNPTDIDAVLKLYQWLCEGDNLNWDPHLFDEPSNEESYGSVDDQCYDYCVSEGISPVGGYFSSNKEDCEAQKNVYVAENMCCCYGLIM